MPDGSVRKHDADGAYEYVVAVQGGYSGEWKPRGWFSDIRDAERCEEANLLAHPRERVALLAVDDPEGDE
jgi:hypothetical protein